MPQAPAPRAPVTGAPASSRTTFPAKTSPAAPRRPGGQRFRGGQRRSGTFGAARGGGTAAKAEHEILFQNYFKSANPQRTYAAQIKRAGNGNHYLVLTEGKRDDGTGEVRKTRVFLYSEDFIEFFKMLQSTAQFIRTNPVPDDVKKKRDRLWAKKAAEAPRPPAMAAS